MMDLKARAELGDILTDIQILLDILAKNPSALEAYPNLKSHLENRSQNRHRISEVPSCNS
ncbi:hypothetical protein [Vibrio sp. HN007]|uniref:hypothetical protein n=1 Tax=Vibrio iocasae TaxID=3098914 RepID=UPI0035D4D20D